MADRADPQELPVVLSALSARARSPAVAQIAKTALAVLEVRREEEDDFLQGGNAAHGNDAERALVEALGATEDAFSLALAGNTMLNSIAFHGNEAAHADQQEALRLLGKARALGSSRASFDLGTFYEHVAETTDQAAAMALYEEGVARGSRAASYPLGWCYFMGRAGVPLDKRAALRCFVTFGTPMATPDYLAVTLPTNTMSLITVAQLLMEEEETFGPQADLVADLLLAAKANGDGGMSGAFLPMLDPAALERARERERKQASMTLADVPRDLWA